MKLRWPRFYRLNPDHSVSPCTIMEVQSDRRVLHDVVSEASVSTIFLGFDHSFLGGTPILFETMVFGGPLDMEQVRYSTWDEAVEGHLAMVHRVREAVRVTAN